MKNIAVVLSGCGVYDGSEIYESVLTLLAIDKAEAKAHCLAPDTPQFHVINHITGQPQEGQSRNVLLESARLARGQITPLSDASPSSFDAAIFPGGFGAAKNTCNYAQNPQAYEVDPQVSQFITAMLEAKKPLGFLCIAPVVAAGVFGSRSPKLTIGNDPDTAKALTNKGAQHIDCPVNEIVTDESLKIVSTPAFMLAKTISELEPGINKLVHKIINW